MSAVLEVGLGLAFLFFVLSLICSAVNEAFAGAVGLRGRTLANGVQQLLTSETERERFYSQPLIKGLYDKRKPSYIPSDRFSLTVMDMYVPQVLRGAKGSAPFAVDTPTAVQQTFDLLWLEARGDADAFNRNVQKWFDDGMDRVSGWYRRRAQVFLAMLAVVVTAVLNVNTVGITQRLWTDAPLRSAVADTGATLSTTPPPADGDPLRRLDEEYRRLQASRLPLGWAEENRPTRWWIGLGGWTITVLAITMGAPFWFDVLTRAARLRPTGAKPEASKPDA